MDESAGEFPSKESILTQLKFMMDDAEAKNVISMDEATYGLQLVEKLHSSDADLSEHTLLVNAETMLKAEEVQNPTLTYEGIITLQLVEEELHKQDDETGISFTPAEISNKIIDSSTKTISEHDEVELRRETTFVSANTTSEAVEVETTTLIDMVTNNTMQLFEELHQQDDETGLRVPSSEFSNKVNDSYVKTLSQDDEVDNCVTTGQATYPGQLVEDLSGQEIGTDSEKLVVEEVKLVLDDEPENIILIEHVNGQQIVEELHQDNETMFSDENVVANTKATLNNDGIENTVSTGLANNDPNLAGDPSQQIDETELGFLSNNNPKAVAETGQQVVSTVSNTELLGVEEMKTTEESHSDMCQDSETRFDDENLVGNMKHLANNDGIENTVSTGQENNDPHLAGDPSQQVDDTELGFLAKNNRKPVAEPETGKQVVGTVSKTELLVIEEMKTAAEESNTDMVEWEGLKHEKIKLKSILNGKRTEITEQLKSLNAEMDQKRKKIEEIAEQVVAIDIEISVMKVQCNESKRRHAEFIELYKLMGESQLPLHSHREIKLFMKKKDKEAQELLSKALDLQFNIESRAKLKLILQEETAELGKLMVAQKLQIHQKLEEIDKLMELEAAVNPDMESTNCSRKRKPHHDEALLEKELCATVQAKRMALNTVDSPQEGINHDMVSHP